MQFMMQPSTVYEYPLWGVGLLLAGAAALGAIVLGLAVRSLLSLELRRRHNDVAAAIFSVIGVTFAVLLAARRGKYCAALVSTNICGARANRLPIRSFKARRENFGIPWPYR